MGGCPDAAGHFWGALGCPSRRGTQWAAGVTPRRSVKRSFLSRTVPVFSPGNLQWLTIMLILDRRHDARSTMSDNTAEGSTPASTTAAAAASGGLIDVGGLNFDELSTAIAGVDLKLALDYIVASGQNGSAYHGFNSSI